MSWEDELYAVEEPQRQTGTDWLQTTTPAAEAKKERRMRKAARRLRRAERKYIRRMNP